MPPAEIVPSLPRLVAAGVVDAQLAALTWLLLEDGVPVLVAAPGGHGDAGPGVGRALLDGLVAALPADRRPGPASPGGAPAAGRVVRVAETLSTTTPPGPLRAALSATTGRSGLAAAIEASDLAAVLAVLRGQGLSDDEVSFLGVVLVLSPNDEPGGGSASPGEVGGASPGEVGGAPRGKVGGAGAPSPARVVAAHYLRPVARDVAGHVQRLGPAVLATWDPGRAAYDHFAWGIYPELAARTGRRAGDLEREHDARRERLQSDVEPGPD